MHSRAAITAKAAVAAVGARVIVYGPLIAAAWFLLPLAVPLLGLAALEPLPTRGLAAATTWVGKHVPLIGKPLDDATQSWLGAGWQKHAGALVVGLGGLLLHLPGPIEWVLAPLLISGLPLAERAVEATINRLPWIEGFRVLRRSPLTASGRVVHGHAAPPPPLGSDTVAPSPEMPGSAAAAAPGTARRALAPGGHAPRAGWPSAAATPRRTQPGTAARPVPRLGVGRPAPGARPPRGTDGGATPPTLG